MGEEKMAWKEGLTVFDLLEGLDKARFCAVVRLNGKLVSRPNFDKTPVPDGSEIVLIPMISGG